MVRLSIHPSHQPTHPSTHSSIHPPIHPSIHGWVVVECMKMSNTWLALPLCLYKGQSEFIQNPGFATHKLGAQPGLDGVRVQKEEVRPRDMDGERVQIHKAVLAGLRLQTCQLVNVTTPPPPPRFKPGSAERSGDSLMVTWPVCRSPRCSQLAHLALPLS